jgi:hypothetical protein
MKDEGLKERRAPFADSSFSLILHPFRTRRFSHGDKEIAGGDRGFRDCRLQLRLADGGQAAGASGSIS